MSELALYHSPGSCARVPLILLQKIGVDYELRIVRLQAGENRAASFQAINPKGKVPVLVRNGEALSENVAILSFLAQQFPQTKLLPHPQDGWGYAQALSLFAYGATTLHPLVGRLRVPGKIAEGEQAQASVKALAIAEMTKALEFYDQLLQGRKWLVGDEWMAPDAYLFWAVSRAGENGVDIGKLPNVAAHYERMKSDPVVAAALAREAAAVAALPPAAAQ